MTRKPLWYEGEFIYLTFEKHDFRAKITLIYATVWAEKESSYKFLNNRNLLDIWQKETSKSTFIKNLDKSFVRKVRSKIFELVN